MLKAPSNIVKSNWLFQNRNATNLVILDATIPNITSDVITSDVEKRQIKGAIFFDIKHEFSDQNSPFPNTVLPSKVFEQRVQNLGICKGSCIVVYDDLGVYSSPRVWWLFTLMGFSNIAVLDGGLPGWKQAGYPVENAQKRQILKGDFEAIYQPQRIALTEQVLEVTKRQSKLILDARSSDRFYGKTPEPRKEVRSGSIPTSKSLPYTTFLEGNYFKSKEVISAILEAKNPEKMPLIFSCGSGITASILALGAEIVGYDSIALYDGSWTVWGSSKLPVENN